MARSAKIRQRAFRLDAQTEIEAERLRRALQERFGFEPTFSELVRAAIKALGREYPAPKERRANA